MKNLIIKCAVILLFFTATSFKKKTATGFVTLEVSYMSVMGGHATVLNTDTNVSYEVTAVDTYGQIEVPEGNYILTAASTNSCSPPLASSVSTSTGSDYFTIDSSTPNFTVYASCY